MVTIEERTPPEDDGVGYIRVWLVAAAVILDVPVHLHPDQVP